jgi:soluble lytic murein transglycosylase
MKLSLFITCLLLSFPLFAQENGDAAFLAAREAFRVGDRNKLELNASRIGNHELAPYVENYQLRLAMDQGDPTALRRFFERHEKTYVAEKLRADWIRWLGKRAMWSDVDAEFVHLLAPDAEVLCYSQQARLARNDKTVLDEAEKTWLTQLEPPPACQPVLEALIWEKRVLADDVWIRARRQFEANRLDWARQTLFYLPPSQTPESHALDAVINSAMGYLARQPSHWNSTRQGRELASMAIQRIATNDPRIATLELEKIQARLHIPERQWAWSQIGLQAAKRHLPEALSWFAKAGQATLSDEGYQWKVRAALREQEWGVVHKTIEAMPPALAAKPEWVYWQGRALKAGGRTSDADALFEKIAGQTNFYGNLADEELGRAILLPPKAAAASADEQKAARLNPGIKRALVFFRLNMRTEAVREWNWSLRGMSDRELLAAADLAKRNLIWDRAIVAADMTQNEHDFSLRFLSPYGEQVRPAAQDQALDDAWVYGLMRQESRFIVGAKSNVGASGLMQLMPATAKWVAKKIGLRDFTPAQVNSTEINVLLGTNYMRMVMENLDNHPVLASAAYNAGPGRAKKWRAEQPLEGAIYAETIPFSETRDYVKKVMSNATYYKLLFTGKPDSLKNRLGTVAPRSMEPARNPELP